MAAGTFRTLKGCQLGEPSPTEARISARLFQIREPPQLLRSCGLLCATCQSSTLRHHLVSGSRVNWHIIHDELKDQSWSKDGAASYLSHQLVQSFVEMSENTPQTENYAELSGLGCVQEPVGLDVIDRVWREGQC